MSGNFIQRGEPALLGKWARARMALLSGADLVVELPVVYAMSSAEFFAWGAVKILDSLGVTDCLCFGSEIGRLNELDRIAGILQQEPEEYQNLLRKALDEGISFPAARESALKAYLQKTADFSGSLEEIVGSSNNILGIEYLKALKELASPILPFTIPRISNSYQSPELTGSISSATAIRRHMHNLGGTGLSQELLNTLPLSSSTILAEELEAGRGPVYPADFSSILLSDIRRLSSEQLKSLPYVSEGLENRIREAASAAGDYDSLLEKICTKRYTRTRIQRSLFHLLTGVTAQEMNTFKEFGGPQYIRVLGFTPKGRQLLAQINKRASLPVIIKTADFKGSCNPLLRRMLEIEATATDLYVLAYKNPRFRQAGQEFTQNVVRI
jgi:predicted nucleotidyltransferase